MFQVAVEACGVASVLMVVVLSLCIRCVMTIIVATNIHTHRLEVADCAKLKPSIFRSSGLGIIAATQLREIPSPRLANAQVDSFKDDTRVDSTELGPVRMSVLKLRDWTKRLPRNLTTATICGRVVL